MMLPIVIRGSEEALRMVPGAFKEAALALGATKWKAVSSTSVSGAAPGIVTSVILGMARVAGETAAIIAVSCVVITRGLPKSPLEPVMALSYNLFVRIVALGEPAAEVFGIALILFSIVTAFAIFAIVLRTYYRRRQPWLR
jgi:phosphate transport system permease protein